MYGYVVQTFASHSSVSPVCYFNSKNQDGVTRQASMTSETSLIMHGSMPKVLDISLQLRLCLYLVSSYIDDTVGLS